MNIKEIDNKANEIISSIGITKARLTTLLKAGGIVLALVLVWKILVIASESRRENEPAEN